MICWLSPKEQRGLHTVHREHRRIVVLVWPVTVRWMMVKLWSGVLRCEEAPVSISCKEKTWLLLVCSFCGGAFVVMKMQQDDRTMMKVVVCFQLHVFGRMSVMMRAPMPTMISVCFVGGR